MKRKMSHLLIAILLLLVTVIGCSNPDSGTGGDASGSPAPSASAAAGTGDGEKAKPYEDVTLKLLVAWSGLSFMAPADLANNPVAKVIKEKTGVTLDIEWITIPEIERLNMLFATGNMPDLVMAPFWGGQDTHTLAIKKAAREGLIQPLNDLIAKHGPNLADAFTTGVASDFRENDLEDASFKGEHYVLPFDTPQTPDDMVEWAHNVFVRKDILAALNMKPSDIKHTDDLYPLLKKIKDGKFTDTLGRPVIPAGAWQNGWNYSLMLNSYAENNFTPFTKIDGKYRFDVFSDLLDKRVLFMRKLVSEGLFDPEAFRQDDTVAKEKMSTGRVAVMAGHYQNMKTVLGTTLYAEHPEMEYVPVGPILDAKGAPSIVESKVLKGMSGTPSIFITKDSKHPEAAVRYLNFINSEEGKLLVALGIEGTHWTKVDGKPKFTKEFLEKKAADPNYAKNQGIASVYSYGVHGRPNKLIEGANPAGEVDQTFQAALDMYERVVVDGYRLTYFNQEYPKYSDIQTLIDGNRQRDVIESAFFAKSDEAALKILDDYRKQLTRGGIEEYEAFMNEKAATRKDIIN